MDLVVFKWLAVVLLLIIGLIGGFLPLWLKKISKLFVHVAYAFSGGILGAVALVHMLADASSTLDDHHVGADFAKALSGGADDNFPMGNALFLIGFFLISSIEVAALHQSSEGHAYDHSGHEHELQQETGLLQETSNSR
eukprot:CAMPEP_0169424826 /NCGR_PEP_ID=MMETSP1017-20121227/68243_1 /TAXON_ID=342587 /ORGANISM="Karlodinium micrum, Strain CCMP2283" /LENGTH=138 /DNA_ID=CAMNT_0009534627 /DNA_START=30 /DNA_END=443 /DNA_ORIENTATION=-